MSGVAKKKDLKVDRRGELIEQNQDGLEYSSEEEVCLILYVYGLPIGGIQQLHGQNFAIFWPPLRGQFLYPECGQKQTFFDPPSSYPRSYWMASYDN